MSIDASKTIPLYYTPLTGKRSRDCTGGVPNVASKFQQNLAQSTDNASTSSRALEQLSANPNVSRLLVANGGYGLQAFVQSLGLMDMDGSLGEACSKLLTLSRTQTPARPQVSVNQRLYIPAATRRAESPDQTTPESAPVQISSQPSTLHSGLREETLFEDNRPSLAMPQALDADPDLSALCARFESGSGAGAIGWDRVGGTSYGLYQIASRPGSMDEFLSYLDVQAPDLAARLRQSGPADTGSKDGAMPDTWRAIATQEPKRFAELQKNFIRQSHFEPAANKVQELTGLSVTNMSQATQEVLWSTAVQHGATGGAQIFAQAAEAAGDPTAPGYEHRLIEEIYAERSDRFASSTQRVQSAVRGRFQAEKQLALAMLQSTSNPA